MLIAASYDAGLDAPMKDIYEIRLENLMFLRRQWSANLFRTRDPEGKPRKDTDANFTEDYGIDASVYSQLKNRTRRMGDDVARNIEERGGLETGWMDNDHSVPQIFSAVGFLAEPTPPSYPNARAGPLSKVGLVRVEESTLAPRVHAGEYILVRAEEENTPPGSDVFIHLKNGQRLIKRLLYRRGDELAFEAINDTGGRVVLNAHEIQSIHLVLAIVPFKELPS